jgi:hypothetical protein
MSKGKGVMYHCFTHNQYCLVIGDKVPKHINSVCTNCSNCQWEDIGSFTMSLALVLHGQSQYLFQSLPLENQNEYFKNKIYDENMRRIEFNS